MCKVILKLLYSWDFFFLGCIFFSLKIRNFGIFQKSFTGRNFEGRTLRFLHLVAYLYLYTILSIFNSFEKRLNINKKI